MLSNFNRLRVIEACEKQLKDFPRWRFSLWEKALENAIKANSSYQKRSWFRLKKKYRTREETIDYLKKLDKQEQYPYFQTNFPILEHFDNHGLNQENAIKDILKACLASKEEFVSLSQKEINYIF
jgi:hypothetical protein